MCSGVNRCVLRGVLQSTNNGLARFKQSLQHHEGGSSLTMAGYHSKCFNTGTVTDILSLISAVEFPFFRYANRFLYSDVNQFLSHLVTTM